MAPEKQPKIDEKPILVKKSLKKDKEQIQK